MQSLEISFDTCYANVKTKKFYFKVLDNFCLQILEMTSIKNINGVQKEILANFMTEHPDLAKSRLSNCSQGKAVSNRLWESLTVKLNAAGPPIKNSKLWRKVYADQKFQVKKKLSFNKASKKKTGGGPFEVLPLSSAEELFLEAAGIEASVKGTSSVQSFAVSSKASETNAEKNLEDSSAEDQSLNEIEDDKIVKRSKKPTASETKINLLKSNLKKIEESKLDISSKLDRLLQLKERSMKMKMEQHDAKMKRLKVDLEIKSFVLEMLKRNQEMLSYNI